MFQKFSKKSNIKIYSRKTSLGAVFTGRFILTIKDLFKRPVFERGDGKRIDSLFTKAKQYNIINQTSTKLSPIEGSFKKNERFVHKILLEKNERK